MTNVQTCCVTAMIIAFLIFMGVLAVQSNRPATPVPVECKKTGAVSLTVERRPHKPCDAGSTPARPTIMV